MNGIVLQLYPSTSTLDQIVSWLARMSINFFPLPLSQELLISQILTGALLKLLWGFFPPKAIAC